MLLLIWGVFRIACFEMFECMHTYDCEDNDLKLQFELPFVFPACGSATQIRLPCDSLSASVEPNYDQKRIPWNDNNV